MGPIQKLSAVVAVLAAALTSLTGCSAETLEQDGVAEDEEMAGTVGEGADEDDVATTEQEWRTKAPACVTITRVRDYTVSPKPAGEDGWYPYPRRDFTVKNGCSTTQTVKIDLAWNFDTRCKTLSPGQSKIFTTEGRSRARGILRC